jgi:hypothetical protein
MRHKRKYPSRTAVLIGLLVAGSWSLAGCDHSLFADENSVTTRKLGYFGDDSSATAAHDQRKQTESMGFGMASGPAE